MAEVKDVKGVGGSFSNEVLISRVIWDFSVDGGAIGTLKLLKAADKIAVRLLGVRVHTAVTSAGALTMNVGEANGDSMISGWAKADISVDAIKQGAAPVLLDANEYVGMSILAATATAGKLEFVFEVIRM